MDEKKGTGVEKWNRSGKKMSVLFKTEKISFEFVRLIALMQMMENPATWILYPNVNFLKALRL